MALDSLVRLRQLHQPEISGYVEKIISKYLLTGVISGGASNTGELTGVFYPRVSNPAQYAKSGDLTGFASKQEVTGNNTALITWATANFYNRNNPSGFITVSCSDNFIQADRINVFGGNNNSLELYDIPNGLNVFEYIVDDIFILRGIYPASVIALSSLGQAYISGMNYISTDNLFSNSINGESIVLPSQTGDFVTKDVFGGISAQRRLNSLRVGFVAPRINFTESDNTCYIEGLRDGWPDQKFVIDFLGNQEIFGFPAEGIPYIGGFDIYASKLYSSGNRVLTTADIANPAKLQSDIWAISGALTNEDLRLRSDINKTVKTTGNQTISGVKTFSSQPIFSNGITTNNIRWGSNYPGIDLSNSYLYDSSSHLVAFDWSNGIFNYLGLQVANLSSGQLSRWETGSSAITLDYNHRVLSGTWDAQGLTINGQPVLGTTIPIDVVRTTGVQTITGVKTFTNNSLVASNIQSILLDGKAIDLEYGVLHNPNSPTINWNQGWLINPATSLYTLDWTNQNLIDVNEITSANWTNRLLYDTNNNQSLDWNNRSLSALNTYITIDWENGLLTDPTNNSLSLDWSNRLLLNPNGFPTIQWQDYFLFDEYHSLSLDWNQRKLVGDWNVENNLNISGTLSIQGQPILTGSGNFVSVDQTGGFIDTSMTGQFMPAGRSGGFVDRSMTGTLMPAGRSGGFVDKSMTGQFMPAGRSGGFVDRSMTGQLIDRSMTGQFFPVGRSGGFIDRSMTGQFITTQNATSYITRSESGQFFAAGRSGGFVDQSMTGDFLTLINLTNYVQRSETGNANTLAGQNSNYYINTTQTGQFMPQGRSGGFVDRSMTGGFLDVSDDALYVKKTESGQFFPTGRSGGFVDKSQTGQFLDSSYLSTLVFANQTGQFFPAGLSGGFVDRSMTGDFIRSSDLTNYVPRNETGNANTLSGQNSSYYINITQSGQFMPIGRTGGFVDKSMTGQYFPAGRSGGFVDRSMTGGFLDISDSGQFFPVGRSGGFVDKSMTGDFLTSISLNNYVTRSETGNANTLAGQNASYYINTTQSGQFMPLGRSGGFVDKSMTGQFLDSSDLLILVQTSQTGQFFPAGRSGGFVDKSQTGQFFPIGRSGGFVDKSMTGQFVTSQEANNFVTRSETGLFVPQQNGSGVLSSGLLIGNYAFRVGSDWDGWWMINGLPRMSVRGIFRSTGGQTLMDISEGYAKDKLGSSSINWDSRILQLGNGTITVDWKNGLLKRSDFSTAINWMTNELSGNWNTQGFSVQGNAVVTNNQTGIFLTTNDAISFVSTGVTGDFVFRYQTGGFVDNSQTGNFITTNQTGTFFPIGRSGGFIDKSMTGQFAPAGKTGQFITTAQTGVFVAKGLTGGFIDQSMTGQFLDTNSTGNFITTNQTGQFFTTSDSRSLSIASYISPRTKLDIGGNGSLHVNSVGLHQIFNANDDGIQVLHTGQAYLNLVTSNNEAQTPIGGVYFSRTWGQPDGHRNIAGIRAVQVGSGTLAGADLQFFTKNNGSATNLHAPSVIIDSFGNVGIQKTGNYPLDVNGSINGSQILVNGIPVVVSTDTGNFIDKSVTGQFFPIGRSGGFIDRAMTGQFFPVGRSGGFVDRSMTGQFMPIGRSGGFIDKSMTGQFVIKNDTGLFVQINTSNRFESADMFVLYDVPNDKNIFDYRADDYLVLRSPWGNKEVSFVSSEAHISGMDYVHTANVICNTINGLSIVTPAQTGQLATQNNLQATGQQLITFSGNQQSFQNNIPSGVEQFGIVYPVPFSSIPRVFVTLEVSGDNVYAVNIRNRSTTGFYAIFSDKIDENGVVLHSFVTINN